MFKRSLTVLAVVMGMLLLGGPAAFAADGIEPCLVSGVSLASTGSSIDVANWMMIGVGLLAVGLTLAIVSPKRRRAPQIDSAAA